MFEWLISISKSHTIAPIIKLKAVKRYIKGESAQALAKELGMSHYDMLTMIKNSRTYKSWIERRSDMNQILIRYSAPSRLCSEEYGSLWKHLKDNEEYDLYIQISPNKDEPHWLKMGEFLEKVFKDKLEDNSFIDECLSKIQ